MEATGQITKKNNDLGYGFISVKGHDDVFFSPKTEYISTDFGSLSVGDKVQIIITETERGLFATSLSNISKKQKPLTGVELY